MLRSEVSSTRLELGYLNRFTDLEPALWEALEDVSQGDFCAALNAIAKTRSEPLPCFTPFHGEAVRDAGGYEAFVTRHRAVPTRTGNLHDLLNALSWFSYPLSKWALNRLQVSAEGDVLPDPRNGRTRLQNRAAQFDEGGVLLLTESSDLVEPARKLRWDEFFVTNREKFGSEVRALVFGHGMLESLRAPFVGLTGKALALRISPCAPRAELDEALSSALPDALAGDGLFPLPLLGVPGWYAPQDPAFYDNSRYFRRKRRHSPGS
jgi:hypothetical protein